MKIDSLMCDVVKAEGNIICYLLNDEPMPHEWLEQQAQEWGCSMVWVSGMNWNDDLTPWKAPAIFRKEPDFGGKGTDFMEMLHVHVLPEIEKYLKVEDPHRSLVGISLSGLFSLWVWAQSDDYEHVASVSGSLWYPDFTEWFRKSVSYKKGKVYLSLGDQEPNQRNAIFKTVGTKTLEVVKILKDIGIDTTFEWNEGNHFVDGLPRLAKALGCIYS